MPFVVSACAALCAECFVRQSPAECFRVVVVAKAGREEADEQNTINSNIVEVVNHLPSQLTSTLTTLFDGLRKELVATRHVSNELSSKQDDTFPTDTATVQPLNAVDVKGNVDGWISNANASASIVPSLPSSWLADFAPAVKIEQFNGNPLQWDMFSESFESLVHGVIPSNAQTIVILRQLLSPELRASIEPSLSSPEMYGQALQNLRRLFGSQSNVFSACIRKSHSIEPIRPRSNRGVERFYFELHGTLNVLWHRGRKVELLQGVVQKLPRDLQEKWAKKVFTCCGAEATLETFDRWLEMLVKVNRTLEPIESRKDNSDSRAMYQRVDRSTGVNDRKRGIGVLSSKKNIVRKRQNTRSSMFYFLAFFQWSKFIATMK
uniref:Retrotransposon gag domain-containing protein n=1 Tax=Trichuris muris TaxID=70415 RepID=A0A5S6QBQ0_TRIMR